MFCKNQALLFTVILGFAVESKSVIECSAGTYFSGEPDSTCRQCGRCFNDTSCDNTTGHCLYNGCRLNYRPPLCNQCVHGKWGSACEKTCGNCAGNSACNQTGHCVGDGISTCQVGFAPPFCSDRCNSSYGHDCLYPCKNCFKDLCDSINGRCAKCVAGYVGELCDVRLPPVISTQPHKLSTTTIVMVKDIDFWDSFYGGVVVTVAAAAPILLFIMILLCILKYKTNRRRKHSLKEMLSVQETLSKQTYFKSMNPEAEIDIQDTFRSRQTEGIPSDCVIETLHHVDEYRSFECSTFMRPITNSQSKVNTSREDASRDQVVSTFSTNSNYVTAVSSPKKVSFDHSSLVQPYDTNESVMFTSRQTLLNKDGAGIIDHQSTVKTSKPDTSRDQVISTTSTNSNYVTPIASPRRGSFDFHLYANPFEAEKGFTLKHQQLKKEEEVTSPLYDEIGQAGFFPN